MQPTREEILIGRVTDGEATQADWRELETLAGADAGVWTRLAAGQRAHADLARAVDDELTVAELVHVPSHSGGHGAMAPVAVKWRAYSGWAAAAVVALAWAGANGMGVGPTMKGGGEIDISGFAPDRLLSQYMNNGKEKGRVLGELPMLMIESTPVPGTSGVGQQVEVVYVRRLLERAIVNDVYTIGTDEHGEPAPVQVNVSAMRGGSSL